MKIKPTDTYRIELFEASPDFLDCNKIPTKPLTFTGAELIHAIISAGMPNTYLTKREIGKRKKEINFKKTLFETFVDATPSRGLSFDSSIKKYLDSTEIGAINYWIGMILVTVLGQKKYGYEFMVHLSMIESFSPVIPKSSLLSTSGGPIELFPDLLAVNLDPEMYGIFESKGYSRYSKATMEHGFNQAKAVGMVNSHSPKNRLAVMTLTGGKTISMREIDPEGNKLDLTVNPNLLYLYHFLPIVELIMELKHERQGDREYGFLSDGDDCYTVSVPSNVYEELSKIAESNKNPFSDESFSETFFSEEHLPTLMLEKSEGMILHVE